ncbi:MAG: helix-turn-helix domain-containing protein, partial [Sulfolobus sp.]|nr:helix-turn-helix domain-containing protein [Sulfolobus sp.]
LTAYTHGYFNYPRKKNADEISELLSMSKVTFLYHIRNVQRKLIDYYLNFYIY